MAAVLVLAGLALAGVVFFITLLALVLKLAFRIIFLPLILLKWIVAAVMLLIVGPVVALVGIVLATVFGLVLSIPLLPLLAVGAVLWFLFAKPARRVAAV